MRDTAVIALERFSESASRIAEAIGGEFIPYHSGVFEEAFASYARIVAVMSAGIVVRGIAPLLRDKWTDPCVVVVGPDMRYAVPVCGGHHGGNDLARELECLGIIPVITTATETMGRPSVEGIAGATGCGILNRDSTRLVNAAILDGDVPVYTIPGPSVAIAEPGVSVLFSKGDYIVGVGCRKGVSAEEVVSAIRTALDEASVSLDEVFAFATTVQKRHEAGLKEAVSLLEGNLVFLKDEVINAQSPPSDSRAGLIGLVGVAEPAALALAVRKEIVMKKQVYGRVTVAIAR